MTTMMNRMTTEAVSVLNRLTTLTPHPDTLNPTQPDDTSLDTGG